MDLRIVVVVVVAGVEEKFDMVTVVVVVVVASVAASVVVVDNSLRWGMIVDPQRVVRKDGLALALLRWVDPWA